MALVISKVEQVSIFGKTHTYKYAACECGSEIVLDDFTNYCDDCERIYDFSGHRLSNPRNWGEETGEHWTDVANYSWHDDW